MQNTHYLETGVIPTTSISYILAERLISELKTPHGRHGVTTEKFEASQGNADPIGLDKVWLGNCFMMAFISLYI
jgi:hypothetical protein